MGNDRPLVLIVDDIQDNLVALRALLSVAFPNLGVIEALDGPSCIRLAREQDPELIILDVVMPRMDGFETCRRLKSAAATSPIPVVFLTALKTEPGLRVKALEAGAEGFLSKPIDEIELTVQIRAMLKVRALHRLQAREKEMIAGLLERRTKELARAKIERGHSQKALRLAEDRYRALFEHMASGCCVDELVYDGTRAVDYRVVDMNSACSDILGLRRESTIGGLASDIYGCSPPPYFEIYRKVAETGEPISFEAYYEICGKHLAMTVSSPSRGFFSTIFSDITERRRMEARLKDSEASLRKAQEVAHVGSWVWRIREDSLEWSDEMYRIFDVDKDSFAGKLSEVIASRIHPEDRGSVELSNRSVAEEGRPRPLRYRVLRRDGTVRTVWGEAGELEKDVWGSPMILRGVVKDITEEVEAERQIRILNQSLERKVRDRTAQLEAANKELEAFAYSVSHDLRAPLRAMRGYSEILLQEGETATEKERKQYLDRMHEVAKKAMALVDDLLELFLISRKELSQDQIDLSALAESVVADLRAAEPGREISVLVAPAMRDQGDQNLLRIVLQNLVGNAWKFTSKTERPSIEFGAEEGAEGLVYHVRDNGAGFDMAYADKLFSPFQRLHDAADFPGAGIGLATVRRILSRHGGRIWAEASPGKGASFYFTLGHG